MSDNVKVAVRVRPFREKNRKAQKIIEMVGTSTFITDPEKRDGDPDAKKKFTFDYSYWSHDGFDERDDGYFCPTNPRYADQKKVFDDLGQGVLDNAWKGYNCSLFAYGQTGSGKSYSMVGYGANKGIVPVTCERLFAVIEEKERASSATEFQVVFSMLEIYNEQIHDLLNPMSVKGGGLKIRENPKRGFYVEKLSSVAVKNYKDIEDRIAEGTKNRTIASTNMNATSSRAHTIVAVTFVQKSKNQDGQLMTKSSIINLVDLAGSERAESTGATGARLQEGAAINKSLSTLGNVIKALADQSTGKKVMVPFRDSALTKLLKNALGGNSKTIMIAALSPADINYDETLSTLRFADRAKSIKTKAVVNESATDKLIRELREENARLLELLKGAGTTGPTTPQPETPQPAPQQQQGNTEVDPELLKVMEEKSQAELNEMMEENRREMEELEKTWAEKLAESQKANMVKDQEEEKRRQEQKTTPHFWNLNEDPQLTGMVVHLIGTGRHRIGNRKAMPPPEILMNGLSIEEEHAVVENGGKSQVTLTPGADAKILVNGKPVDCQILLHHNDRVMFGSTNLYVFHHPMELEKLLAKNEKPAVITYDCAQEEVAASSGIDTTTEGKSKEDILLQEDLITLMPMIHEANAMSEELNKKVIFELVLVSPQARGLEEGRTEVKVKMRHLEKGYAWVWHRNAFLDRKYRMQEMYQNYVEGEDWNLPKDKDPFWDSLDSDIQIGSVWVHILSLRHNIEMKGDFGITDLKGNEHGHLGVEIVPCRADGTLYGDDDDYYVEQPEELISKPMHIMLRITNARDLPCNTKNVFCQFKFYLDEDYIKTGSVSDTRNPNFNFSHHFTINPVTKQFLEFLDKPLIIEVMGQQSDCDKTADRRSNSIHSTKQLISMETARRGSMAPLCTQLTQLNTKGESQSIDKHYHLMCELSASKKQRERLETKLKRLNKMIQDAKKGGKDSIKVDAVENILNMDAPNMQSVAATVIALNNPATSKPHLQDKRIHSAPTKMDNSAVCSIM